MILNGEEKSVVAKDFNDVVVLSNAEDFSNPPNDVWVLQYDSEEGKMIAGTSGAFLGATISVYYDETVTTQKWSVKKLAYDLLPDQLFSTLREMMEKLSSQIKSLQVDPVFSGSFSQNRNPEGIIGNNSHAEGYSTTASEFCAHAEGDHTVASGDCSHAEGNSTKASGNNSHAEGDHTVASGDCSHAEGMYNIDDDTNIDKLHIVGNGKYNKRSNAHTLDKSGNAWYAGDVYVGSTSGTNRDAGSKKLATEAYVDSRLFTFTITPMNGPGIQMLSATRAEMLAALDAGKTLLGYWTETRTILETTDTIKHEFRLESVSGTGASRGLAFVNYEQFYKSTLYVNGNDTVSFVDKEVLPIPTTKTEAMTQSVGMDDDGRLWTEPGTSGGGVTTLHINVTAVDDNLQHATFTADKTTSEMKQAAATGPIWCVITFAAGIAGDNPVTYGLPPAWYGGIPAFGYGVALGHLENGNNDIRCAVRGTTNNTWLIEIGAFGS